MIVVALAFRTRLPSNVLINRFTIFTHCPTIRAFGYKFMRTGFSNTKRKKRRCTTEFSFNSTCYHRFKFEKHFRLTLKTDRGLKFRANVAFMNDLTLLHSHSRENGSALSIRHDSKEKIPRNTSISDETSFLSVKCYDFRLSNVCVSSFVPHRFNNAQQRLLSIHLQTL